MSILTYGSVKYLGDVTPLQLNEPVFTVNGFGSDQCSVRWQLPTPQVKAWLDARPYFSALAKYPSMYLINHGGDDHQQYNTFTLNYTGIRDGKAKTPKMEDDLSNQSVTSTITDDTLGKVTLSCNYLAARTTYKWTSLTKLTASPYKFTRNFATPFAEDGRIISTRVSDDTGPLTSVGLDVFNKLINALNLVFIVSFTSDEVVPGCVWECTATVDYVYQGI